MRRSLENNRGFDRAAQAVDRDEEQPLSLVSSDPREDRILYVRDVRLLLRNAKSEWWVRNRFAPEARFKVGRSPAWWEKDARAWLRRRSGK
jgi:hypothetical protein